MIEDLSHRARVVDQRDHAHRAAQWIAEQCQGNCPDPRGVGDEGRTPAGGAYLFWY